ncbi:MAG: hypothetical protein ABSC17_00585 [Thermacetogeniaceae bacterium]
MKIVSERLGHKNIGMTLKIYAHVLPDSQLEAVKALNQVFGWHQLAITVLAEQNACGARLPRHIHNHH